MLFWYVLAGAVASLSLPPLFLLPAIFALSIPFLGYVGAKSRREAAVIFAAAGLGWFLASTYWVSNSLIVSVPSNWFLMPFMALALALTLASFWAVAGAFSFSFLISTSEHRTDDFSAVCIDVSASSIKSMTFAMPMVRPLRE